MLRSLRLVCAALSAVTLLAAVGCATTGPTAHSAAVEQSHESGSAGSPRFVHCVFFTFKPGVTDEQVSEFIHDCHLLRQIPAVRRLDAGRRDLRMARDVNVTDYQVGLVVYFDDKAGHDAYSVHPVHEQLLKKHQDRWEKVRVYDFDAQR